VAFVEGNELEMHPWIQNVMSRFSKDEIKEVAKDLNPLRAELVGQVTVAFLATLFDVRLARMFTIQSAI
jgi:hypothetical protein